jgi:hypothetical protein
MSVCASAKRSNVSPDARIALMGWKIPPNVTIMLKICTPFPRSRVVTPLPGGVGLVTCATRTRLMGCAHSGGVSGWSPVRPELDLWVALTPGGCQIGCMDTILRLSAAEPCFDAQ